MQRITVATGDLVVAANIQEILHSLADPGILSGLEMTTAAQDIIAILPGTALMDNGLLYVEDEQRQQLFPLSVAPANYTLYYQHANSQTFGGNPALLVLQPGLIPPTTFTGGFIVGWIQYPGGSVPLSTTSMFISGPRLRLARPQQKQPNEFTMAYAPFSPKWMQQALVGVSPIISDLFNVPGNTIVTKVLNGSGIISRSNYYVPFKVPSFGIGELSAEIQADSGSLVTVTLIASNGVESIPTPTGTNQWTNTPLTHRTFKIPAVANSSLLSGSQAFIKVRFELQSLNSALVKSLGVSSYTDPF